MDFGLGLRFLVCGLGTALSTDLVTVQTCIDSPNRGALRHSDVAHSSVVETPKTLSARRESLFLTRECVIFCIANTTVFYKVRDYFRQLKNS